MGIFYSVSFWIVFFSLILSCLIGSFTHWIIGTVFFFILAGKALIVGLILDTISGSLKYHHDRNDDRVKKEIASLMLFKAAGSGVKHTTNYASQKIINIRR